MKNIILFFFLLLISAQPAWAKSKIHPQILFTWLAIGSTLMVIALWIMIWNRRKK